jgi:asparagine synthase (glutamine-hydrolysing)
MRLRLNCGYLRKTDITSSAHGLETRVPFLDNKMLELTERLPSRFKIKGSQTKYLSYQLAKRYLPPEITSRPKHGFNFHMETWMYAKKINTFVKDLIFDPKARWREILDDNYVQTIWEDFAQNENTANVRRYNNYVDRIYYLTVMELWLQKWKATI